MRKAHSCVAVALCLLLPGTRGVFCAEVDAVAKRHESVRSAVEGLRASALGRMNVRESRTTGLVTFLAVKNGSIPLALGTDESPSRRALEFVARHGQAFGIAYAGDMKVGRISPEDRVGMTHVRLRQTHAGIPIMGGEMIVHLRGDDVVAVNARTLPALENVAIAPAISAETALAEARDLMEKRYGMSGSKYGEPQLEIFNRGLLDGREHPTYLAW